MLNKLTVTLLFPFGYRLLIRLEGSSLTSTISENVLSRFQKENYETRAIKFEIKALSTSFQFFKISTFYDCTKDTLRNFYELDSDIDDILIVFCICK